MEIHEAPMQRICCATSFHRLGHEATTAGGSPKDGH